MHLTWSVPVSNKSLADFFFIYRYCITKVIEPVLGIRLKQLSFGADPDTDLPFYFDTDQYLDPTRGFRHVEKKPFLYFVSQQCHPTLFYLSRQRHRCHNFHYFEHNIEIFWKV